MIVPGGDRDWVMLEINAGTTFLDEKAVTWCAQAALDGPEVTYMRVVHLLSSMAMLASVESPGDPIWPYEVAELVAAALRDAHEQITAEFGEEQLRERYEMTAVEVSRVLEQVEADINAKAEAELKRRRVRRNA